MGTVVALAPLKTRASHALWKKGRVTVHSFPYPSARTILYAPVITSEYLRRRSYSPWQSANTSMSNFVLETVSLISSDGQRD
jgi:hypothetical protein